MFMKDRFVCIKEKMTDILCLKVMINYIAIFAQ